MSFPKYKYENLFLTGVVNTLRASEDLLTLAFGDNPGTQEERNEYIEEMLSQMPGVTFESVTESDPEALEDPRILRIRRAYDMRFKVGLPMIVVSVESCAQMGTVTTTQNHECKFMIMSALAAEDDAEGQKIEEIIGGIRDIYYSESFIADVNELSGGDLKISYKESAEPSGFGMSDEYIRAASLPITIRGTITPQDEPSI